MNKNKVIDVPYVAEKLLSLALPARVREPILGDLAEEYLLDIVPEIGLLRGKGWYYLQVAKSISVYAWKEKGGIMAFLWGLIFFIFLTFMAFAFDFSTFIFNGAKVLWFLDLPSLMIVLFPAIVFGIGATSVDAAKLSLKLSFSEHPDIAQKLVKEACNFLKVTGNLSIPLGWFATFIGWIILGQNLDLSDLSVLGPANSIAIITIAYGIGFKIIFYTAEMKIRNKYLEE